MNIDTQFQSFVQCLDCEAKCNSNRFSASTQNPQIWILFGWQVVSTVGWLDALCSYIASKHDAKLCTLMISPIENEEHLAVFYTGLQQVAVALGNIPSLENLELFRCFYEYEAMENLNHCSCHWECKRFILDHTKTHEKVDYRSEAIVLQHVRQITKFFRGPERRDDPPVASSNIAEFAEALQDHPFLASFIFYSEPRQKTIHKALLSIPKLAIVTTFLSFFTAETVGEFVAKDSMRELSLDEFGVTTTRELVALCNALGRKSAKLTSLHISMSEFPSESEFYAELSSALLTNESLEILTVIPWISYKRGNILLPPHGAALARALVNHPRLHELHLSAPSDLPPEDYRVWQDLFCNGVAQMKSLRQLLLLRLPVWTPPMIQALQRLVPFLSNLTISWINTTKEWLDVAYCVIYGVRLTTLSIELEPSRQHEEGLQHAEEMQQYAKLMEGVLAMNEAGRQYILDDAMNKCKAIVVLESVTDNLDCLYIHLRESFLFG